MQNKISQRSQFSQSQGPTTHSERVFKQLAGGSIDLSFNTIKDIKKVSWQNEAPWFREIEDGFCWVAYCTNKDLQSQEVFEAVQRAEQYDPLTEQNSEEIKKQYPTSQKYECPAFGNIVILNRGFKMANYR